MEDGELAPDAAGLERAIRPLFDEGHAIQLDADGRSPRNTVIEPAGDAWQVTQNILVNGEVSEYTVRGRVDLVRSARERRPVFLLDHVGAG